VVAALAPPIFVFVRMRVVVMRDCIIIMVSTLVAVNPLKAILLLMYTVPYLLALWLFI
jgi:hypothetical protein